MRTLFIAVAFVFCFSIASAQPVGTLLKVDPRTDQPQEEYTIGIDDVLEIAVLQPEKLVTISTVAPDGSITFPYIGSVQVQGMTLADIQETIQSALADGYMKYPVVTVSLKQARSRKFFVYGEVMKPGTFHLKPNTTVLRAVTMAGGFTKFGSKSRVKILRPKKDEPGYDMVKVNIKKLMNGNSQEDILLEPEDIIVVSEGGVF
ncbi:MAG: polysaccharide export protein [Candidatus Omnitrophica bacterium]|nr:polysaccharide export protein [Candidatus Omnitrophota bacterium]